MSTSDEQARPPADRDPASRGYEIGAIDVVLGILTFPLLFWALMYAVTGHEQLYATRAGRMRVYRVLLVIEVVFVAAAAAWWYTR